MNVLSRVTAAQWAASSQAISYWVACAFWEFIDYFKLFQMYRIRPSDEECRKNTVNRGEVFWHMVLYHITTIITILLQYKIFPPAVEYEGDFGTMQSLRKYLAAAVPGLSEGLLLTGLVWTLRLGYLATRQLLALVILDAWIFWGHYALHQNAWLYRNVHSLHHRLYTPYSYGALYNHWVESTFSDGLGGWLGITAMGLTAAEQIVFFAVVTAKTVEDHVSYELPWTPCAVFSRMTGSGAQYHGIHHATWGLKTNFEVYFTWWDRWMNTSYQGSRSLKEVVHPKSNADRGAGGAKLANVTKED